MVEKKTGGSAFYTMTQVATGVYAAVDKGSQTGSNAGIIDLGGLTVVFDTFVNVDASRELRQSCLALTGRDAGYVVNSHSHVDHTAGNGIFASAMILSSGQVRQQIAVTRQEFEQEKATYPEEIKKAEAALPEAVETAQAEDLRNTLFYLKNLSKPGVDLRVPDMGFHGEVILHGSNRSLRLLSFKAAHSKGDVIALLPDCRVCFMGDMLFNGMHPWLGLGEPEGFLTALDQVLAMEADCFIPGHGPVSGRSSVMLEMQYIHEILTLVRSRKSQDPNDYAPGDLSSPFHQWAGPCFSWNIKYLIGRELSGK